MLRYCLYAVIVSIVVSNLIDSGIARVKSTTLRDACEGSSLETRRDRCIVLDI